MKNAKIKVTKDGPYLVTGSIPLLRMIIETDKYGNPIYGERSRDILNKKAMSSAAVENQ